MELDIKSDFEKYSKAYSILVKKIRQKKNLSKETLQKVNGLTNGKEPIENQNPISINQASEEEHVDVGDNDYPELVDDNRQDSEDDSELSLRKNDRYDTQSNDVVNTYPCDVCHSFFRTLENFNLHKKVHEMMKQEGKESKLRKRWSCGSCLGNFITEQSFLKHVCDKIKRTLDDSSEEEDIQCTEELFSCSDCYAMYRRKEDLEEHKKINHNTNYVCNICSKSFMFKAAYDKHTMIHTTVREYHCKLCSKICKTQADLKKHNVVHQRDILNLAVSAIDSNEDVAKKIEVKSTEKKQLMLGCSVKLGPKLPLNMEVTCEDYQPESENFLPQEKSTSAMKKKLSPKKKVIVKSKSFDDLTGSESPVSLKSNKKSPKKRTKVHDKSVASEPNENDAVNDQILLPNGNAVASSIISPQELCFKIGGNKPKCQLCFSSFENQEALLNHIEKHLGQRVEIRGKVRKTTNITSDSDDIEILEDDTVMPVIKSTRSLARKNKKPGRKRKIGRKTKTTRVSGRDRPLKRNPEPIFLPRPEPFASPRPSGTPRPNDENGSIFDPNYIIKLEPEDKELSSPARKKKRLTKTSLAKVYVTISDGDKMKRVKVLKYMESFKKLSVKLDRVSHVTRV